MRRFTVLKSFCILALALPVTACHKKPPAPAHPLSEAPPPAPPPPPICTLTGDPAALNPGQSVTLSWTTKDATDVVLQPGSGKQLAQGSTTASPAESTTYTLTATGPGGQVTCTARVTVISQPAPPLASVKEENLAPISGTTIKDAYFDLDQYALRSDAQQALTQDAAFFKARPEIKFTIEGHCDQRGSEEYNFGLGDLRATAAKNFLANSGVTANRMSTISFGKDRPVCTEAVEECWQKNRRAHITLPEAGAK